jgi:hypothetical protein
MTESILPWATSNVFEYYFSNDCEVACGIPVDETSFFDPLAAVASIHELVVNAEYESAKDKLELLGQLFMATSMKRPDIVRYLELEETVQNFDNNFDKFLESLEDEDD